MTGRVLRLVAAARDIFQTNERMQTRTEVDLEKAAHTSNYSIEFFDQKMMRNADGSFEMSFFHPFCPLHQTESYPFCRISHFLVFILFL
jgi:hypothetical protein